jgi:hypothetical protein
MGSRLLLLSSGIAPVREPRQASTDPYCLPPLARGGTVVRCGRVRPALEHGCGIYRKHSGGRAPKLVAAVRRVASKLGPTTALTGWLLQPRLDVVLSHEADYVDDLDGRIAAVVANATDRRDPVPWALDLGSLEP